MDTGDPDVTVTDLEAIVIGIGHALFAADEEGGVEGEDRLDQNASEAIRALLQRGSEGQDVITRLFGHVNPEVVLIAASGALLAGFEVPSAKTALQSLNESTAGNGWPAHYARKVLGRHQ